MADAEPKAALIVGVSRGLGLAIVRELLGRGWLGTATERKREGSGLSNTATASGGCERIETLDMTDPVSLEAIRGRLSGVTYDLIFVVAGIANGPGERVDETSTDEFNRVMVTNALSPMRVIAALEDRVRLDGTIAVMSSSLGSVSLNVGGTWEVYRASKAALNTLMRSYAARHTGGRNLALVDPGWVKTDMGGSEATLTIEQSIPGVVDALTAHAGSPGLRYLNYKDETVPW